MARLPRLALAGELHHVLLRGHPAQAVFADPVDRDAFVEMLKLALPHVGVALHAYVLVPGEAHFLATPAQAESLGRLMQSLGRRFGAGFNRRHARQGAVWDGRFRCSVIEAARHLVEATVMLETLPVQAGLVARAQDWRWSSAPHHLGQVRDGLITEHPLHWALGNTPFDRERAHANLLERNVESAAAGRLDLAVRRSLVLGSEAFVSRVAAVTGRPLAPRARGRPRNHKAV